MMPNALADGALSGAGPLAGQGPQVDAPAMQSAPVTPQKSTTPEEVIQTIHKQSIVDGKLRTLLDKGGPISRKQVTQIAIEIVAGRVMSAQTMAGILADLPEDPEAIREWVEVHAKEVEAHLEQLLTMLHGTVDPSTPMGAFGDALNADQHQAAAMQGASQTPLTSQQVQ